MQVKLLDGVPLAQARADIQELLRDPGSQQAETLQKFIRGELDPAVAVERPCDIVSPAHDVDCTPLPQVKQAWSASFKELMQHCCWTE